MARLSEVFEEMATAPAPRVYVHLDCRNTRTGNEWSHLVDATTAEASARDIERRWPFVTTTIRPRGAKPARRKGRK